MSKEDDIKFLKIQTCVLKVNIHCDGCKQKVKKLLLKVDGVFQTTIDAEQGRVTVSGNVDPATLIKKLNKAGKHAELLLPKGVNFTQLQRPQLANPKAQHNKDNGKPPKAVAGNGNGNFGGGGGKDQKGQPTPLPQLQQMKGFKDLKLPQFKLPFHKDSKSVKFALPPEVCDDGSDYDDFDDDDDEDFDDEEIDEFYSFDADFDDDCRNLKLKPGSAQPNAANGMPMMHDKKNGKKEGGVEIPVQVKGMNFNNDAKNGKKGGGNQNQGSGKNVGKVSAATAGGGQDIRNAGNSGNPKPNANAGKKGGGGGNGKNEVVGGGSVPAKGGPMGPPAGFQAGMNAGQMGLMPPVGHAAGAGQFLPAGMAPPGYFPGGGMPALSPEMMAAAAAAGGGGGGGVGHPYQQQYMAALMQQQQRMMMNGQDRGYPPMMGYPRPPPPPPAMYMPPPAMYMPPPPPYGEPYANYFSDENANSCSIM